MVRTLLLLWALSAPGRNRVDWEQTGRYMTLTAPCTDVDVCEGKRYLVEEKCKFGECLWFQTGCQFGTVDPEELDEGQWLVGCNATMVTEAG